MLTFALLYILGTVDAAMSGFRDAAGRSALIRKRSYYLKAMLRGAFAGQLILMPALVAGYWLIQSSESAMVLDDMRRVGEKMLMVYLPYSAMISFAFALRAIPSVDIRSAASILLFGPLLILRPMVALAGALYGAAFSTRTETLSISLSVVILMLSLERLLGWLRWPRDK